MSFKIDTAYHFPITIPDASLTQDGVMTKAQVAKLAMAATDIYWPASKPWSDVLAELTAANFKATVYIEPFAYVTIGAGTYDFKDVIFTTTGDRAILDLDFGVRLDGGDNAYFTGENLLLFGQERLMEPGTMGVIITLTSSIFSNYGSAEPLFTTDCTTGFAFVDLGLIGSSLGNEAGGTSIIQMSGPSGYCVLFATGGGYPQIPVVYRTNLGAYILDGVPGSGYAFVLDPLSSANVQSAVSPVPTTTVFAPATTLSFPQRNATQRGTPSFANVGQTLWNTTSGTPQVSDGTEWRDLSAPKAFTTGTRPLPNTVPVGTQIYNTTTNIPNWSDGANWRDAAGVIV
jgi:hypothetical protein